MSTLCALVSVDECDDLQNELQENYFPAKTPDVEKEEGDLFVSAGQGLRQFKYQCLQQKYPILQRHTLRQILALLVNHDASVLNSANIQWELTRRNMPDDIRTCALSAPSGGLYRRLLWSVVSELTHISKWREVIELLANCPSSATELDPDWQVLKDHVLCCAGLAAEVDEKTSSEFGDATAVTTSGNWIFLLQIKDKELRIRTILGNLRRWSVRTCVGLLKACQSWELDNGDLTGALKQRLRELDIFQKVCNKLFKGIRVNVFW